MSGSGRYHGKAGFEVFSNPKSICVSKAFNPYPLVCRFPPYTDKSKKLMLKLVKSGGITRQQLTKGIVLVVLLIIIGLVVGLVIVPNVTNK